MALYTIRSFKSLVAQPDVKWANTYEIVWEDAMDYTTAESFGTVITAAEAAMHIDVVSFDRVTVSTWVADSEPYDPDNLFTFSPAEPIVGDNAIIGDPEVLDTVLWVKRIGNSGRNGRLFYRGVLTAADTQENAKRKPSLTPAGTNRANALLASFKAILDLAAPIPAFVMAGQSQIGIKYHAAAEDEKQKVTKLWGPVKTRPVRDFVIGGVTRVTTDNAYYDVAE